MEDKYFELLSKQILDKILYPNLGKRMMYNESMELVPDTTLEQNVDLSKYKARHYRDPLYFIYNQSPLDTKMGETVMVKNPTVKLVLLSPFYRTRDNVKSAINYLRFFGGNSPVIIPVPEEIESNKKNK